jgi:acyl-CoA synthetase (NDP forming)
MSELSPIGLSAKTSGLYPPRSIAIVGASRLVGGSYYGARLFNNVINAGPEATVYPVNPRLAGEDIDGHKVYAGLADLPEVPEMVVMTTPISTILPLLEEAAALGTRIGVVISAHKGSAEEQRAFDQSVGELSARTGMQIIGPNSMGIMNAHAGINASFTSATHGVGLNKGPVAAVAQSGAAIAYLLQVFRGTAMGYSWLISTGNEAAASLETLLDDVIADEKTEVVMLFVEGVTDGKQFRRAALKAQLAGKALLMLNSGTSEAGREAVQSHTGRIAGTPEMLQALAREAHIVASKSYADFFDAAKALTFQSLKRKAMAHGRRAVIVTTSGGAGTVTSDQLSALGWTLPALPPAIEARLAEIAKQAHVSNPVDITGAFADKTMLPRILDVLNDFDDVDAIFVVTGAGGTLAEGVAEEIKGAADALRPEVYVAWVGLTPAVEAVFDGSAATAFPDPLRAVAAAEASAVFRVGQSQKTVAVESLALLENKTAPKLGRVGTWTAAETIADLSALGAAAAPSVRVDGSNQQQVLAVAHDIGYPVVVKIDAEDLSHKSDADGVRLNIKSDEQIGAVLTDFAGIRTTMNIEDPGVLIQAMLKGTEVLVGIKHDDAFGHLLVLGLGGIHAELHADSAVSLLLPASRADIANLVARQPKLVALLSGYRGAPAGNAEALIDTIAVIANWADRLGASLKEADFNPVIVNEKGAYLVDGRAFVTAQEEMN